VKIVFAGTPGFSVACLNALLAADGIDVVGVVSQPDRPAGRGMKLTASPVKQAALAAGIDVITPEKLRANDAALAWLQSKQCDVLVVVAFGMILPKSWLDAPAVAPLNVHASLLPRWRGAAPIERALLAGDTETGVGLMHMEEGLDTGGVYAESRIAITAQTTAGELWEKLAVMGAELLVNSLPKLVAGELTRSEQDDVRVTYAAKLKNEERIIDWQMSATQLDRYVRCFTPRPGMRTQVNGKWLKVIRGEVLDTLTRHAAGTLINQKAFDMACSEGSVYRLLEVQPEGKQAMAAEAFLRGAQLAQGQVLV